MSDEEWVFFERFILSSRAPNGRKPANHRLVLDGIFWIARTGAPWRDQPEEFGNWTSVYRQFQRWTLAGLWEEMNSLELTSFLVKTSCDLSSFLQLDRVGAGCGRLTTLSDSTYDAAMTFAFYTPQRISA